MTNTNKEPWWKGNGWYVIHIQGIKEPHIIQLSESIRPPHLLMFDAGCPFGAKVEKASGPFTPEQIAERLESPATPEINQDLINRIVEQAKNSPFGLDDPEKGEWAYNLDQYADKDLDSLALLLVSAQHSKYSIVSLVQAAFKELTGQK